MEVVTTFYGDTETYCETPLAHGLHRYAEAVETTVFARAPDAGPVEVTDCTRHRLLYPLDPADLIKGRDVG